MKIDIKQLEFIDARLRTMVTELEAELGVEFTITSLYRINDNGVHGQLPLRGLDLRCRNAELGKFVEDYVNSRWQYDPSRPSMQCCMCHTVGRGLHLHLQVHANTLAR